VKSYEQKRMVLEQIIVK